MQASAALVAGVEVWGGRLGPYVVADHPVTVSGRQVAIGRFVEARYPIRDSYAVDGAPCDRVCLGDGGEVGEGAAVDDGSAGVEIDGDER
jgi:hypothetical protein